MSVRDLLCTGHHSSHCLRLSCLAEDGLVAGGSCLVAPAPGLSVSGGEETIDNSLVLVLSLTVEDVSGGGGRLTTRLHYGRLPGSKLSSPASRGSHLDGVAVCEVTRHQALTAPVACSVWTGEGSVQEPDSPRSQHPTVQVSTLVNTVQSGVLVHPESSLCVGVSQQSRQSALPGSLTEVSVDHDVLQYSEATQRIVSQVLSVVIAHTRPVGQSLPAVAT